VLGTCGPAVSRPHLWGRPCQRGSGHSPRRGIANHRDREASPLGRRRTASMSFEKPCTSAIPSGNTVPSGTHLMICILPDSSSSQCCSLAIYTARSTALAGDESCKRIFELAAKPTLSKAVEASSRTDMDAPDRLLQAGLLPRAARELGVSFPCLGLCQRSYMSRVMVFTVPRHRRRPPFWHSACE